MTVPKECITLYYSGDAPQDTCNNKPIRPAIRLFPEAFGTNELEYCEPVNEDSVELTKDHKDVYAEENLPLSKLPLSMYTFPIEPESVFGSVLPNLKIQDFAWP